MTTLAADIPVRLTDTFDGQTLRALQEGIASITHLPTLICDPRGRPIIGPSGPSAGLAALQASPAGRQRLAAILAELAQDPDWSAHDTLVFKAAAIQDGGPPMGVVVVGGLPSGPLNAEQLARLADEFGLTPEHLELVRSTLKPWPILDQRSASELVRLMAGIIARLAVTGNRLQHREGELGTVYAIAEMMAGTQDLQQILNRIARQVCEVMQVRSCSIRLLNEETGELVIKAVHNLSRSYLDKGPVILEENPIDRAAFEGEAVYVEDAARDPRTRFPQQAEKEGIVSGLSVGMTYRGQTIGVMRVYTGEVHRFSTAETALLRSIASQAAAAIINTRLYLEALEAHQYQREISYAGDIQRRMIPREPPSHPKVEFAAAYVPSSGVGGDFYDFFDFRETGEVGVCVADVAGKGIPAALLMAALRTAFRLYVFSTMEITEAMTMTNIHMHRETMVSEFATLFYGVFSHDGRSLSFCNAGHDPPMLCRKGRIRTLSSNDFIIGVNPNESYHKRTIALRKGDVILFYTDGVIDAQNFDGERLGRERLAESLIRCAGDSAARITRHLMWDLRRFAGLTDQSDDITMVVAKIT